MQPHYKNNQFLGRACQNSHSCQMREVNCVGDKSTVFVALEFLICFQNLRICEHDHYKDIVEIFTAASTVETLSFDIGWVPMICTSNVRDRNTHLCQKGTYVPLFNLYQFLKNKC